MSARMRRKFSLLAAAGLFVFDSASAATVLFSETFNGVNGPWTCSAGVMGCDPVQLGVPTQASHQSDQNWYGARFETPDGGTIASDVGVQRYGGGAPNNSTPVGRAADDAGLMFRIDTTGYTNVTLSYDWRTFQAEGGDRLVVGYFVGDLTAGHPAGFAANRTIDLRNAANGGANGYWNWGVQDAGNTGNWIEVMRGIPSNAWDHKTISLTAAANQASVWVAFWLDNGNGDFGKFDNVKVEATVVPIPAAVWLFGSGLLGLIGIATRRRA